MISPVHVALALGLFAIFVAAAHWRYGILHYLRKNRRAPRGQIVWQERAVTPLSERKHRPQGLAWVDGRLYLACTWRDTKTRIYEFDPQTMIASRHFDMPPEAVHTSGLSWDGERLWGVDYISHRAYCLDLERSFSTGLPHVLGSFATGLRGTSACCCITWRGEQVMAISDFMNSRRTILVRIDEALARGSAGPATIFSYRNEGFSQGLEFIEGYLYEAENKVGLNIINQLDLQRLEETADARRSTVRQYFAPGSGVEDLAWSGQSLWTTDEWRFRIYEGAFADLSPAVRLKEAEGRKHGS